MISSSRPRSASAQGVPDPSSDVRDPRAAPARDLFLVRDSIRQLASDDQGVPDQATKDVRDPIEATRSIPARVPFVSSSRLNSFGGPIQQSSKIKRLQHVRSLTPRAVAAVSRTDRRLTCTGSDAPPPPCLEAPFVTIGRLMKETPNISQTSRVPTGTGAHPSGSYWSTPVWFGSIIPSISAGTALCCFVPPLGRSDLMGPLGLEGALGHDRSLHGPDRRTSKGRLGLSCYPVGSRQLDQAS
ncbi:hypothetical protein DY000_02014231 [Brassica cretica]|uniref:Uncharacterized protein n=1 Tax=Brassica cretica TaxID=69181 RepID=A0ABQ7D3F3_BRACR|nr:hypothetical protein DY000_02014231 [Brassica cretica]